MVNVSTNDGLSGQYYGASVVAEQFAYMMRMGYQTSRLAAEYAGWYAVTGDPAYKDKAYRGFNLFDVYDEVERRIVGWPDRLCWLLVG